MSALEPTLKELIVSALPNRLSPLGLRSLDSFLNLELAPAWRPADLHLGEISRVFNVGLPLAMLGPNLSAEGHRKVISEAVSKHLQIPVSVSSEVHVAALLRHWGAEVAFVPRGAEPTPDIRARWTNDLTVDVEVTRGETKQLHSAVQEGLQQLSGALRPGGLPWNIIAFTADASNPKILSAMLEAATNLTPGQSSGEDGEWFLNVVAEDQREEVTGAFAVELFRPSWWPRDQPAYFASSVLVGAPGNPAVVLRSLIPKASYANPIRRKAASRQRLESNPYVIALDVTDLPEAHERISIDLSGFLELWDHVSAVLLFQPVFYVGADKKEFLVSLHLNPAAKLILPTELASFGSRGKMTIEFKLGESLP